MTRISDQAGAAITNMEPGKRGIRAYFDVDDINAGAARVRELGGGANDPSAPAPTG
jgi:predicted enzyme related to lactoylglutathione lyase